MLREEEEDFGLLSGLDVGVVLRVVADIGTVRILVVLGELGEEGEDVTAATCFLLDELGSTWKLSATFEVVMGVGAWSVTRVSVGVYVDVGLAFM